MEGRRAESRPASDAFWRQKEQSTAKSETRSKLLAVLEVTLFLAVLMAIAHLALPKGPRGLRHLSITLLWTIPPWAYVVLGATRLNPYTMVGAMLGALFFGAVRERSGSVLGSAVVHGGTNACLEVYRHVFSAR